MQRSSLPLTLALVTFALALLSGGYAYNQLLRTVPALVAVQDLPAGTELTPDMVRVIRVPAGGRPPRALFGPGQIAGKYAEVPLFAEQVITERHVTGEPPVKDALSALSPGHRIVSVPVKPEAALGGALHPGDLVDVVAAWPGQDGKPGPVEVLATGIRVVDLRNNAGASTSATPAEQDSRTSAVPTAVLLQVANQQARTLVSAVESKAAIYLWLAGRDAK